jgi:Ni,Fe-hydrogenase III large subunit
MNEERTGKCLLQVEHIRGHLWHRYSIADNQVMVATVKLSRDPMTSGWKAYSGVAIDMFPIYSISFH